MLARQKSHNGNRRPMATLTVKVELNKNEVNVVRFRKLLDMAANAGKERRHHREDGSKEEGEGSETSDSDSEDLEEEGEGEEEEEESPSSAEEAEEDNEIDEHRGSEEPAVREY